MGKIKWIEITMDETIELMGTTMGKI